MNLTGAKPGAYDLRRILHIALRDLHPQIVKVRIRDLQIGRVETDEIGVVRVGDRRRSGCPGNKG